MTRKPTLLVSTTWTPDSVPDWSRSVSEHIPGPGSAFTSDRFTADATASLLIGSGGMGEVYKAHDERLNRTVASKRMFADDVSRFQSQARAIAAINHPNIRQIYGVGPDTLSSSISKGNHSAVRLLETKLCGWRSRLLTDCTQRTNPAFFTAI